VCVLREIFRTLAAKAGLEEDPWEGVRLRPDDSHSRRELTMDELRRLLAAAQRMGGRVVVDSCSRRAEDDDCASLSADQHKKERDHHSTTTTPNYNSSNELHTLFLIGIYTGLRLGDCCRLDWSDINIAAGIIQLVPRKTRRHAHGKPVTIPIHPALGRALLESLKQSNNSNNQTILAGPVLPTLCAMYQCSRWQVSHELAKVFKAANITMSVRLEGRRHRTPEATFHSLRHTFVSFAANAGVPLHIVQSIVGHESTAMTRHYYHENLVALKQAVNAIPAL